MATLDFNTLLATAKTASFAILPDGDYDVECVEASATTSSTGKPMIKGKFKVITGPHAKATVFNQFVLSIENANALNMFFRHMKAFGLDEQYFAALGAAGDLSAIAAVLVGRSARFTLGHRKYQGEDRNEVKAVKPIVGGAPNALPGSGAPGLPGLPTSAAPAAVPVAPVQPVQVVQPTALVQPVVSAPSVPPAPPAQPAPVAQPVAPVAPVEQPAVQPVAQAAPVAAAPEAAPVAAPVAAVAPPAPPVQAAPQPVAPQQPAEIQPAAGVAPPPPMPF